MCGSFIGSTAKDTVGAHFYIDIIWNENINTAKDSRYLNGTVFFDNSIFKVTVYTTKDSS